MNMRKYYFARSRTALAVACVLGFALFTPRSAFGAAAQLLSGKKKVHTKVSVVKTDPALHEIEAVFDPMITGTEDFSIQSFDLSVLYDTSLVSVNSITLVSPFLTPPGDPGPVFDSTGVHHIRGDDAFVESGGIGSPNSVTGNEDLFDIDFTLKPGVPDDTPVTFELIANDPGNFIMALDPLLSDLSLASEEDFTGDDVEDSFLTASDIAGQIAAGDLPQGAAVPLPAGVWQGMIAGLLLLAGNVIHGRMRRRAGGAGCRATSIL